MAWPMPREAPVTSAVCPASGLSTLPLTLPLPFGLQRRRTDAGSCNARHRSCPCRCAVRAPVSTLPGPHSMKRRGTGADQRADQVCSSAPGWPAAGAAAPGCHPVRRGRRSPTGLQNAICGAARRAACECRGELCRRGRISELCAGTLIGSSTARLAPRALQPLERAIRRPWRDRRSRPGRAN